MSELQCPIHAWCDDRDPGHIREHVHGITFSASAEENSVDVVVQHCERGTEDDWHLSIDFGEWIIDANTSRELGPEIDREFANIRSIVDQIETKVRAFHAANVGSPIRRHSDVLQQLDALADR